MLQYPREDAMKKSFVFFAIGVLLAAGALQAAGADSAGSGDETAVSVMLKYKAQEKTLAKARKLLQRRQTSQGEAGLLECLQSVPGHYEAHYLLAHLAADRGEFPAAVSHMERAEAEMDRLAGLCRAWQEEHDREETADRELVSGASQESLITSPCAANSTRVDIGRLNRERGIAKGPALAPLDPRRFDVPAAYLFEHGNFLFKSRLWAEAAARYRLAVERDPGLAGAWNNLLSSLMLAGQVNEARDWLGRAVQAGVEVNSELRRTVETAAPR
jgi:pentatricopeptide repeat protein